MFKKFLIVMISVTALFLISCDDTDSGDEGYYVSLKQDGVYAKLTAGDTDHPDEAYGCVSATSIAIIGDNSQDDDQWIDIDVTGTTTGTYTKAAGTTFFSYGDLNGKEYQTSTATVEVTTVEELGGVIEGTFEGTLTGMASPGTAIITEGKFRVLRIPCPTS